MSTEAESAKRQASDAADAQPVKKAKQVGDGTGDKTEEEFRNYEDSDRHSVRRCPVVGRAACEGAKGIGQH